MAGLTRVVTIRDQAGGSFGYRRGNLGRRPCIGERARQSLGKRAHDLERLAYAEHTARGPVAALQIVATRVDRHLEVQDRLALRHALSGQQQVPGRLLNSVGRRLGLELHLGKHGPRGGKPALDIGVLSGNVAHTVAHVADLALQSLPLGTDLLETSLTLQDLLPEVLARGCFSGDHRAGGADEAEQGSGPEGRGAHAQISRR